jgi:hypothetical protein
MGNTGSEGLRGIMQKKIGVRQTGKAFIKNQVFSQLVRLKYKKCRIFIVMWGNEYF